jgi:hypothetical protein
MSHKLECAVQEELRAPTIAGSGLRRIDPIDSQVAQIEQIGAFAKGAKVEGRVAEAL